MTRNAAWGLVGNTVYAGCQWAVFVLIVHRLRVEEAGAFALATALTGPVFVLASLRLRNLLATSAAAESFPDYLTARLLTTALAVPACLAVARFDPSGASTIGLIAVIAGGRACEAISDICHGLFQREMEMRSAAIGLIANGVGSVALVFAALIASPSLPLAAAAYSTGSLLALAAWDLPCAVQRVRGVQPAGWFALPWRTRLGRAAPLIGTAAPMGLSAVIGSLQTNLPRYVIASVLGPGALAVFAALSYVTMAGHLVVNAASQAALPLLASDVRHSRERYHARLATLVGGMAAVGALVIGLSLVFARPVLVLVYGADYGQYASVLVWLSAATVVSFTSVFLGTGVTARQRFAVQPAISAAAFAAVAIAARPLAVRFGLIGASWALLAGALIELAAYLAVLWRDARDEAIDVGPASVAVPAAAAPPPLKVLNVLGRLERAGAELRAVELAESFAPARVRSDFVVLTGLDGALDDRVRRAGGRVIKCRLDGRFPVAFLRLLRTERYDVVHSHVHFFSGVILALARLAGVRLRVGHLHTARVNDRRDTLRRRVQLAFCRWLLRRNATAIIAAGEGAMESAWGRDWSADTRCRVVYNTVRSDRLPAPLPRRPLEPTLINVATVKPLKNQLRLVGLMRHLVATLPDARLLLVGKEDPEYGAAVRRAAATAGVARHLQMVGEVDEPMSWLASAHLMVLPSMWEGLPCAVLEAAAVGTPVLASDLPGTREIARHFSHVHLIPADADDQTWAAAAARLIDRGAPDADEAATVFARSPFVFERSCEAHYQIWSGFRATA
jgi:O-antigen/teichoic acid export membrane protein/glycosyltransferase involved in cell wall biosynthesis